MNLCYLVGYPVGHSMSPPMHNAAFKALGLDYQYRLASVQPKTLGEWVEDTLRRPEVKGCSVTIPHKIEVMKYLDEVTDSAAEIGAVNTVVDQDGHLTGTNTDSSGGIKALKEEYGTLDGTNIVVLGAGGASRAIVYGLAQSRCTVTVLNRTPERAEALVDDLLDLPATLNHGPLKDLDRYVGEANIIVNATPVGMAPQTQSTPVPSELLHSGLLIYDVVYNPLKTRLLCEAEIAGARTLAGVKMLVYQGAEAFRLWTGRDPPIDLMLQTVLEHLGEKK